MNLILPVGFGLIFAALFIVFAAVGGLTKERLASTGPSPCSRRSPPRPRR